MLKEIIGHRIQLKIAERLLNKGVQILLFSGPRGIGKWSSAMALMGHLFNTWNVHTFKLDLKSQFHSIKSIRNFLKDSCSYSIVGGTSCFLFDEAEKISEIVSSSLLKILEEPPSKVVVVLVCNNHSELSPTLLSRCVKVPFFPLSKTDVDDVVLKLAPKINKLLLDNWSYLGSPGTVLDILKLKESGWLAICEELFHDLPIKIERFYKLVTRIETLNRKQTFASNPPWFSIDLFFELILLYCQKRKLLPHRTEVRHLARELIEAKESVKRGLSISVTIESTWIRMGFVDH